MDLSCYQLEVVREDPDLVLYRGRPDNGSAPILVLAPTPRHVATSYLRRLQHEHALSDKLDSSWAIRPSALVRHGRHMALVLDDPGGHPLDALIGARLELSRCLRIAVGLAACIRKLHQQGLVHKDIKPANVFVDETDLVRLTGFGFASPLSRERQPPAAPDLLEGTLAYMAPERTGRVNRSIDARSDLYSLGITFYEMLVGTPPFVSTDPIEVIHCHVARRPPAPSERIDGVPRILDAVIMKLLAKNAEDRYQTAAGVEFDLRRCLSRLGDLQVIDPFALGERDISDQFLIPERLYGREREVAALVDAFDHVAHHGRFEFLLISGPSGIGKSSLVGELRRAPQNRRAMIVEGRSDQFKRGIPFASVAEAFKGLLRQILSQNDIELDRWRESLRRAVGSSGQLMVDLIPDLGIILGDQPSVPRDSPEAERSRFLALFHRFVGVFARPEHPLVLFLDDLQWLDSASLGLLERLASDEEIPYLFLIGAYRTDDVEALSELRSTLASIGAAKRAPKEIALRPLIPAEISRLIADVLRTDSAAVDVLSDLVHQKTQGNAFFIRQFLTSLHRDGLICFDPVAGAWEWELPAIRSQGMTDNVATLMAATLARFDTSVLESLKQLACLGTRAHASTLAKVVGVSEDAIHAALRDLVGDDLLHRVGAIYVFSHDRVREAAYAQIPGADRACRHLKIARRLVAGIDKKALEDQIFDILDHYKQGAALIESQDEMAFLAELNLIAGKRAKAATAYESALTYLTDGCELMGEASWDRHYEVRFGLEFHLAECHFLVGDIVMAEARLSRLSSRCANPADRASIVARMMILYTHLGEIDRALELVIHCLETFGEVLRIDPTDGDLEEEYRALLAIIGERSIGSLIDLPSMTDVALRTVMELLEAASGPAGVFNVDLLTVIQLRMARLSIQYGPTDEATHAYAGLARAFGWRIGSFELGQSFRSLAMRLVDERGFGRCAERVYSVIAGVVAPYTDPLTECADLALRAIELGPERGGLSYAGYSWALVVGFSLDSGQPLAEVQRRAEVALSVVRDRKFTSAIEMVAIPLMLVRALRGLTGHLQSMSDSDESEADYERRLISEPSFRPNVPRYWARKLQWRFHIGDLPSCLQAIAAIEQGIATPPIYELVCEFTFFAALTRAAVLSGSVEDRGETLRNLASGHANLAAWAARCPVNFADRASLVGAEIARLDGRVADAGRLYEEAIRLAREHGYVQNEGLANELAARFYAPQGLTAIADAYARNARACYVRWGADGIVRQLDQTYPHLTEEAVPRIASKADARARLQRLDVAAVLEMHQVVSREIVLDRVIERLLTTVVEHAGAVRGLLLLPHDGQMRLVAEAVTGDHSVNVHLRHQATSGGELPESVLNYVVRTQECLILADATDAPVHCADEYVVRTRPRSVLCLPLVKQKRLVGALYLENTLSTHVFTVDRLAVLQLLASQAAISIENAKLFQDIQMAQEQARRVGDELRRSFDVIPALAWRAAPDGAVEFANRQWHDYTGIGAEEALGGTWIRGFHPDDVEKVDAAWGQAFSEKMAGEVEARMRRLDGEFRSFLVRITPMQGGQGNVVAWHGTHTDIEMLKHAALEQEALARVSRLTAMGELGVSIAHEVSQPLMAIVTNAMTCLRWLSDDQCDIKNARMAAERIIGDSHRARDVIIGIRTLAKKGVPQTGEFDINALIIEVLALTRNEIERHGILVETDLCIDAGPVRGVRVQIQQVILNFVMNAMEAITSGSHLRQLQVRSQRDGADCLVVSVADSGVGVEPGNREKIFEAFFTTKSEGIGIGLSICKSIIEAHGGRLWLSPNYPHGSVFSFSVPRL